MAAGKFYTEAAMNSKEAERILKKVAITKSINKSTPVMAMLGFMFLGTVNALLCTDTTIVYYNYNGGMKLESSQYPIESVTSISTSATTVGREILLGINGTTGVSLKIVADGEDVGLMVAYVQQRILGNTAKGCAAASTSAEEIKKYHDLMEQGVITAEEFEAKKKQLLGL